MAIEPNRAPRDGGITRSGDLSAMQRRSRFRVRRRGKISHYDIGASVVVIVALAVFTRLMTL